MGQDVHDTVIVIREQRKHVAADVPGGEHPAGYGDGAEDNDEEVVALDLAFRQQVREQTHHAHDDAR